MSESSMTAETIRPIAELFRSSVTALWVTTFNLDLGLFNEFLLRRLGDAPLNVVVLADQQRLSKSLGRISMDNAEALAPVNRRWLLRGAPVGNGAFHPKTFLAITGKRAKLLVGSGNLSRNGLDGGSEVFTEFNSGTTIGNAAIAAWQTWMRRIIEMIGDITLASRFKDLEQRFPDVPPLAPAVEEPLLHNLDRSIADQFAEGILSETDGRVDELLLSAPFYDQDAKAVEQLLGNLKPRKVSLYLTNSIAVNGKSLSSVLSACGAAVDIFGYEPDKFVHAKLVGAIYGGRCWLLTGSANLSKAGLTLSLNTGGNVELGVVADVTESELRALLVPPNTVAAARAFDSLDSLKAETYHEDSRRIQLVLKSASRLPDGTVQIYCESKAGEDWLLDDFSNHFPLAFEASGRIVTKEPIGGRLVQIVDSTGDPLSNIVVVDDPDSLEAILSERADSSRTDRPKELSPSDVDTRLGEALVWLNRYFVMDVSEQTRLTSITDKTDEDATDDEFWERLEREQLARDPRVDRYRIIMRGRVPGTMEPIFELLDMLRDRVIGPRKEYASEDSIVPFILNKEPASEGDDKPKHKWSTSAKIRLRARNTLHRWAAAQTDPRLMWIDPLAPAGNFAVISAFLAFLWYEESANPGSIELTSEDLNDIWLDWLTRFVGTGQGDGWLDQLDEETLGRALQRLPGWCPEIAAALCWIAVRPGKDYKDRVLSWQPQIAMALDRMIIEPNSNTAEYLSEIAHTDVKPDEIDEDLLNAVEYIDDELWQHRISEQLGLLAVRLQAPPNKDVVQVRVDVRGIADPMLDNRVPVLLASACQYRRCDGVALFDIDDGWRLVHANGKPIRYMPVLGKDIFNSTQALSSSLLDKLAFTGGVIADLFPADFVELGSTKQSA